MTSLFDSEHTSGCFFFLPREEHHVSHQDVCVCSLIHHHRRILLNYAVFNPDMGYCQGMSDLVAPLLTEIQDESDTFWCFVGLMENTIFISSPRDEDMERQLVGGWVGRVGLGPSRFCDMKTSVSGMTTASPPDSRCTCGNCCASCCPASTST